MIQKQQLLILHRQNCSSFFTKKYIFEYKYKRDDFKIRVT